MDHHEEDTALEIVEEVIVISDTEFRDMFEKTETGMKNVNLQDHDYSAAAISHQSPVHSQRKVKYRQH